MLEAFWNVPPQLPSAYAPEVPAALDELVMALWNAAPLARPSSAAEVISRLTVLCDLAPDQRRIAHSFLTAPPFVGRDEALRVLSAGVSGQHRAHSARRRQGPGLVALALPFASLSRRTSLRADREQLVRMGGHFLPTGYPPLIAKCERVAALEGRRVVRALSASGDLELTTVAER